MVRRPHIPAPGGGGPTVAEAEAILRGAGGRLTAAKRDLLTALHDATEPLTAEDLRGLVEEMDEATVYRNLTQFEECGLIVHSHHAHGPSVYRWAGTPVVPAACEQCGAVVELDASLFDGIAEQLHSRHSFELNLGHFALTGLCASCRAGGQSTH